MFWELFRDVDGLSEIMGNPMNEPRDYFHLGDSSQNLGGFWISLATDQKWGVPPTFEHKIISGHGNLETRCFLCTHVLPKGSQLRRGSLESNTKIRTNRVFIHRSIHLSEPASRQNTKDSTIAFLSKIQFWAPQLCLFVYKPHKYIYKLYKPKNT
jgi:hypothetical protein